MVSDSLSLDKTIPVLTFTNSHHPAIHTNTTPCLLEQGVKVPRHISRSIMRALQIVSPFNLHQATFNPELFRPGSLEDLVQHGLHALRETLQQDKELNVNNTSIGIIGPASPFETNVPQNGPFRILENEQVEPFLKTIIPKEEAAPTSAPSVPAATTDEDVQMQE